jgi:hypothetical protein
MTFAVIVIVGVTILSILGYRFNKSGLEQGALVQFDSHPGGATVMIDGSSNGVGGHTPAKASLTAGQHTFTIQSVGYQTWSKTLTLASGTLTWLDYGRLIPVDLPINKVLDYPTLVSAVPSPDQQNILVQTDAASPNFNLVSISSDTVKQTQVSLPTEIYSVSSETGATHNFKVIGWDGGGRYVLLDHTYGNQKEWLVLDTENPSSSENITTTLSVDIHDVTFAGSSGSVFYGIDSSNNLRRYDLSAGTISRVLVANVKSYDLYENNIISYVGTTTTNPAEQVVGLYRDGDDAPVVLKTVTTDPTMHINYAHYYNNHYVAISEGSQVTILKGSLPRSTADSSSLKSFANFNTDATVTDLSFAPSGQYVVAQSAAAFTSYDVGYSRKTTVSLQTPSQTKPLQWLDNAYLWGDSDSKLTIREFDGTNVHTINAVAPGFGATLTSNGRWLYSVGKTETGYQLQRVRLILQ